MKKSIFGAIVSILLLISLLLSGCNKNTPGMPGWQRDPIVPGYSMAEINIGDTFAAVQSVLGDPDQQRKDGGYQVAYYGRIAQEGNLDDPGAWEVVVTLYDNGDGVLDEGDQVGSVEVSGSYAGKTSGDVGLGSSVQDVEGEFGACDNISQSGDSNLKVYSYDDRGVSFLFSAQDEVMTIVVTAYGGLRNAEENEELSGNQGGAFGVFATAPIVPGQTAAGLNIGQEFKNVKEKYGNPDSSGSTTEGLVFATYTWGYGTWKLNLYLEDKDQNGSLGDYDVVVSISVRFPYKGQTPKGSGIGAPEAAVAREFGTPENQSITQHQGQEMKIMEYNTKGIVFALSTSNDLVEEIDVNKPL